MTTSAADREPAQIIRWEEPPPASKRSEGRRLPGSKYATVAAQLRAQPGRWAVVREIRRQGNGLAAHIRMGHMQCFMPAGDFDAVERRVDGVTTTYARYVGDGDA